MTKLSASLVICLALPGFAFAQANEKKLAVVNGETITETELEIMNE